MNAKQAKFALTVFSLFFTFSSYGEISPKFLLQVRDILHARPEPPFSTHFSSEEQIFLQQALLSNYSDILAPIKTDLDLSSYGFWNPMTPPERFLEQEQTVGGGCYSVYTNDGVQFDERPLNSEPDDDFKGWSFSYCAGADLKADQNSVLYFFHGATGNPEHWLNRRANFLIREHWRQLGVMPKWVSISVGKIGHLAELHKEQRFFDVIVPYVEKHLGFTQKPKVRLGIGMSQGGANIVHILMKRPRFFDAAAAACPAISTLAPKFSLGELLDYKIRTSAWATFIKFAVKRMPREFKKLQYWQDNVDPLILGQKLLGPETSPFYLQTNSQDQFGFQEGGQLFAMLARIRNAPISFEALSGGHCSIAPENIANFLSNEQKKKGEPPHS